jgi:hypothetical protein
MYAITDPQIARLQIDDRIRAAEARRTARAIRREARTQPATDPAGRGRRVWRVRAGQRAFA